MNLVLRIQPTLAHPPGGPKYMFSTPAKEGHKKMRRRCKEFKHLILFFSLGVTFYFTIEKAGKKILIGMLTVYYSLSTSGTLHKAALLDTCMYTQFDITNKTM